MSKTQTLLYNRYSVVHIEKTSNFSKVFYALDTYQNPPRSCLIKVFEPIVQKLEIAKWISEEFQKEAKRLKQLSLGDRHLPQIYTYSTEFQVYYIVRELIEGKTLREIQSENFSISEVREIMLELLSVLDYLHQHEVVHQNIKPKNIILRDEDGLPILINFGSIKQIVATYGFYGNKQIFSTNNLYGYAPPEQVIGRSLPASDLYSLGLTAIYLLTAKNPIDLAINSSSGNFQIPETIVRLNSDFAAIISRAISPNISDRYSSAKEMSSALLSVSSSKDVASKPYHTSSKQADKLDTKNARNRQKDLSLWKTIVYALSGLYIISIGIIAVYDWKLSQNISAIQLPSTSLSSPTIPTASEKPVESVEPVEPVENKRSILGSQSRSIAIPILPTGTQKQQLKEVLGQPNAIEKGYWANSTAWIYQDRADGSIDLGYLFDLDTDKLRQTEVAIAPSIGLKTINDILDSLLLGKITPPISQGLEKVYRREVDKYSFKLVNLEGSIEREADGHIYLGVWEADFH